jgi:uncharacterized protein
MFFDSSYLLWVLIPSVILGLVAQWRVRSAFSTWVRVPNERGLTGVQTAQLIMRHAGLEHVGIGQTAGELTDHYDPRDKTIHLSQSSVQPSVAAMAIVAHELGHAEQDKTGNRMLGLRSALVPAANIGSQLSWLLIMGGLLLGLTGLAWLGVLLFAAAVAFTLITLPVEFDASRRARRYLDDLNLVSATEARGVDAVLSAAAMTYVAAAAGAVLQLLYWVSLLSGRRD